MKIAGIALLAFFLIGAGFVLSGRMGTAPSSYTPPSEQVAQNTPPVAGDEEETPVALTISTPAENAVVRSANLTIRGKTAAYADVFVNDEEAKADALGNFAVALTLEEGENPIIIVVTDEVGNTAQAEILVTYEV
jgi:hypothetical protein